METILASFFLLAHLTKLSHNGKNSCRNTTIALNLLLQGSARLTMRELTGTAIVKWLDVELPKVQNRRMDLLGETADGSLFHMELQSTNEAAIPLRMAEYS